MPIAVARPGRGPGRPDNGRMGEDPRTRLSAEVFGLLARFVHQGGTDSAAELRRHDLTPAQFQLLLAVRRRPGVLQRELGEHLRVTGANVSMLVAKLERADLLRREPVGAANRVVLTDAGSALVDRLRPEQDEWLRARFAALDDEDLDRLRALLTAVLAGLPPTT